MKKVLLLGLGVLMLATSIAALSDFKGKESTVISLYDKNTKLAKLKEVTEVQTAADVGGKLYPRITIDGFAIEANLLQETIWSDGFEGTEDQWLPMSGYDFNFTPTGQDSSQWYLEDVIVNNGAASWGASDAGDHSRDWLVSPVISIPDSVTDFGVTTPLKLTTLRMAVNAQAPGGFFAMRVALDDDRWEQTATGPLVGTSSWYVDASSGSNNSRYWANTPDIDLTGETSVSLTFKHEGISEDAGSEWDLATVDVSDDGWETYQVVARFHGAWGPVVETVDLTAWVGGPIQLRFRYSGDESFIQSGSFWMFDSVEVNGANLIYSNGGGDAGAADDLVTGGFSNASTISPFFSADRGGWEVINFGNILNASVPPGTDIRLAVNWVHDPTDAVEDPGFFIDDVVLEGVGDVPTDLALVRLTNSQTVALNEFADFSWVVQNVGLDPLTGSVTVKAEVFDETGAKVATVQNLPQSISNLLPGEYLELGFLDFTNWLAVEPGDYVVDAQALFTGDQFTDNNFLSYNLHVFEPPFSGALYAENFEVGLSYESLGWDLVDPDVDTTNTITWRWEDFVFDHGGTIGGWALGAAAGLDINLDEASDETLISTPINISNVGDNNRLMLEFYFYWRVGHSAPSLAGITAGKDSTLTSFEVSVSDDGVNWYSVYYVEHQDTVWNDCFPDPEDPSDPCDRIRGFQTVDISDFIGAESIWLSFNYSSDHSNSFFNYFDDILVFQAVGKSYINSVDDIPGDQGRQVRVNWYQSGNDSRIFDENGIPFAATEYSLWRWISGAMTAASDRPVTTVKDFDELVAIAKFAETEARFHVSSANDNFDFIAMIPVTEVSDYHYVAPTLYDIDESVFGVLTHTENDFVYSRSNLQGGASTDDLAPAAPAELVGNVSNINVELTWLLGDPRDDTFKENNVFRGTTDNTATMTLLASTSANDYIDGTAEIGVDYYYAITSVDHAGNESDFSNVVAVIITGIDDESNLPTEFALRQNYPNPFNPSTTINYSLPTASDVKIVVYNILGKEIATLVNGQQAAGYHNVAWNGRNASGQLVSTGVYFYRINADDFIAIRKMILMK